MKENGSLENGLDSEGCIALQMMGELAIRVSFSTIKNMVYLWSNTAMAEYTMVYLNWIKWGKGL